MLGGRGKIKIGRKQNNSPKVTFTRWNLKAYVGIILQLEVNKIRVKAGNPLSRFCCDLLAIIATVAVRLLTPLRWNCDSYASVRKVES
jgi:hypothetical protein